MLPVPGILRSTRPGRLTTGTSRAKYRHRGLPAFPGLRYCRGRDRARHGQRGTKAAGSVLSGTQFRTRPGDQPAAWILCGYDSLASRRSSAGDPGCCPRDTVLQAEGAVWRARGRCHSGVGCHLRRHDTRRGSQDGSHARLGPVSNSFHGGRSTMVRRWRPRRR